MSSLSSVNILKCFFLNNLCNNIFYCNLQAGEALGAIGSAEVLDVLREYAKDPQTEVH